MTVFRLYLVNKVTNKKTGNKRDYPSLNHLYKYGIDTYHRYNQREDVKGALYFLNTNNKWEPVSKENMLKLLNNNYGK